MFIILALSSKDRVTKSVDRVTKYKELFCQDSLDLNSLVFNFVTAENNLRLKIPEIKIIEEFTEGDDEKFESRYANYPEYMKIIQKVSRKENRSQTMFTQKFTPIEPEIRPEENKVNTTKFTRKETRSQTLTNPDQSKFLNPVDTTYSNRLLNYSGLKEKPTEPTKPTEPKEEEVKTKKFIREKGRSQTLSYPVQNVTPMKAKIVSEDDEVEKTKKFIRQKHRAQTLCYPIQTKNFNTLKPLKKMAKNYSEDSKVETLEQQIDVWKTGLHTGIQLKGQEWREEEKEKQWNPKF